MQINTLFATNTQLTNGTKVADTDNLFARLNSDFKTEITDAMRRGAGNDFVLKLSENRQRFVELAMMAQQQEPVDSKKFIKSLSFEDRQVLQKVHSLGVSITDSNVDKMSGEGADNLLLIPGKGLDANNDAITEIGTAKSFKFPNSNTPADVAAAWNKSLEGSSPEDRLMATASIMTMMFSANVRVDADGNFLGVNEPGSPEYVNPMADPNFSYKDWAKGQLEYNEAFKHKIPSNVYERDVKFLSSFLLNLNNDIA
ncbi:MAG: hypothetical protein MJK10_15785 [Pseudomonadales bacterium]|nr:hypothetical protein [Pseudomonadales bacterium]NRA17534.1 hypothetical protein [Oceanospirillaceae bacterium]